MWLIFGRHPPVLRRCALFPTLTKLFGNDCLFLDVLYMIEMAADISERVTTSKILLGTFLTSESESPTACLRDKIDITFKCGVLQ